MNDKKKIPPGSLTKKKQKQQKNHLFLIFVFQFLVRKNVEYFKISIF